MNPITSSQILAFARKLKHQYPKGKNKGLCVEASSEMFEHFYPLGLVCSVISGFYNREEHSWFEFFDGTNNIVVDITADQFDSKLPSIIMENVENLPQYTYDQRINSFS